MLADRQGNRLSGATMRSVALFDQAVEAFNIYRGDPLALVDEAIGEAPEFAMAHILKAHLLALATEPEAAADARSIVARVRAMPCNEREALPCRRARSGPRRPLDCRSGGRRPSCRALSPRSPGAAVGAPDGFLSRQRPQPPRPDRPRPAELVGGHSRLPDRTRHVRFRAGGDRRLRPCRGKGAAGGRAAAARLLGSSRCCARDGDAGARGGRDPLDGNARALLVGGGQLLQGPQLVASGPL
jgi:hypothetical protein